MNDITEIKNCVFISMIPVYNHHGHLLLALPREDIAKCSTSICKIIQENLPGYRNIILYNNAYESISSEHGADQQIKFGVILP